MGEGLHEAPVDVLQMYVREVVGGPYCGGTDEGNMLANFLLMVWPRYQKIRVSFRDIDVVEFPFCWALARALVPATGADGLEAKLEITSLSERALFLLNKAITFARQDDITGDTPRG